MIFYNNAYFYTALAADKLEKKNSRYQGFTENCLLKAQKQGHRLCEIQQPGV